MKIKIVQQDEGKEVYFIDDKGEELPFYKYIELKIGGSYEVEIKTDK